MGVIDTMDKEHDDFEALIPVQYEHDHFLYLTPVQYGKLRDRYEIYVDCADDGNGYDLTSGEPLKTFDEWLDS